MAINEERSKYLASLDRRLKAYYAAGLSWLTYAPIKDAPAEAASYRSTYSRVELGPEFSDEGDLLDQRLGIWIQHPPIAPPSTLRPPGVPPPLPAPKPDLPPPPAATFRIGISAFGLPGASDDWIADFVAQCVARGYSQSRVWFNWPKPTNASRVVLADGSLNAGLLAHMKVIGAGMLSAGMVIDVTLGSAWDSFAAQLAGTAALTTALVGENWVTYIDVCNEWNGNRSAAQVAALIAACRSADPARALTASVSGDPATVLASYGSLVAAGQTVDLATPHFPRDSRWMHTGPRLAAIQPGLAAMGITRYQLQEENRLGSDGYQPQSAAEYFTASIEGRAAGAEVFVFHQDAAYDPTDGLFRSQLASPIETNVFDHLQAAVP